jgi:uncharacterized membrane protein
MNKGRLEAFSDGVIAILITIMVLELHVPHGDNIKDVIPVLPALACYVLSFVNIGIYWNNHHHLLYSVDKINGVILWANLNLLFWLSLIPFVTEWMGENHFGRWPVVCYGCIMSMCGIAYNILCNLLVRQCGKDSPLAIAVRDNWKGRLSTVLNTTAIALAFLNPWLALGMYVIVAVMWFIPDRRIEKTITSSPETSSPETSAHETSSPKKGAGLKKGEGL